MLLSNLDVIAQAPQGIARLRELILTLAVQGKLVPQDPKDEPASELLKKIRAEKDRLIAEGKIKKDKPLAAITEEEKPFELPEGWEWGRLGEVTNYGSPDKAKDIDAETWVLDMEDVEKSTGRLIQRVKLKDRESLSEKNSFEKGDVIYGKLRPYLNKVLVADADGICTTEFVPIKSYGFIEPKYLKISLSNPVFLAYTEAKLYGMKMPRLGTADARSALVSLPSFSEQSRIVARVEELMRLCDALEEKGRLEQTQHQQLLQALLDSLIQNQSAQELAQNWQRLAQHFDLLIDRPEAVDALEQTILQLAVRGLLVEQNAKDEPASELLKKIREEKHRLISAGEIKRDKQLPLVTDEENSFELPLGWEWVSVDQIANVGTGTTPSRDNYRYFNEGNIPWVTSGETGRSFICATEQYVTEYALEKTSLHVYPIGTLIVAMYGQGKTRGQVAELQIAAATNQACAAICLVEKSEIHRGYVKLVFEKSYDEIREQSAGGAQPNLNVGKVKTTPVPLPPLAEQSRIVARVTELRALCQQLRDKLTLARSTQAQLAQAMADSALQA